MEYALSAAQADEVLRALSRDFTVCAPKRFPKAGRYSDTDIVRYDRVEKFSDIVWETKSDYPAKEAVSPIQQTLFYFTEDEFRESKGPKKPILLFARPCDIHAQRIQAKIYAGNGGFEDFYYTRVRNLVKFAMMECGVGDDTCFCVSMGTNRTEDCSMAVKFSAEGMQVQLNEEAFLPYFQGMPETSYTPAFVEENVLKVEPPDLSDEGVYQALKKHPMWKEFDSRCTSCGSCTVACSTCTCFTTRDVLYGDNAEVGERRRVAASCQVAGFDQMAGQRELRSTPGDRMRYKVLHKFHDYKARFGESHMCVGCGRCIHRCPEFISIAETVRKMSAAVQEIQEEQSRAQAGAGVQP